MGSMLKETAPKYPSRVIRNLQKLSKLVCTLLYHKRERHCNYRTLFKYTTIKVHIHVLNKMNRLYIDCLSFTQLFKLSTILLTMGILNVVQGVDAKPSKEVLLLNTLEMRSGCSPSSESLICQLFPQPIRHCCSTRFRHAGHTKFILL